MKRSSRKLDFQETRTVLLEPAPRETPLEEEIEVEADGEDFTVEEILDSQVRWRTSLLDQVA